MKREFTLTDDGFKGIFYEGLKNKDKAIIYIGAAGTDEEMTNNASHFLQKEGYSVLVVGFYMWEGLPKEMYRIPVDYVENAVKWLRSQGFEKIGIIGTSTGAGYSLLCTSLIPEISCIVAVSPLDYVMEGVKGMLFRQNCPVYTYKGKDFPYSKFSIYDRGILWGLAGFFKNHDYDLPHLMRYSYDIADYTEESRIKVENMKADVLMLAPNTDDCWPSEKAVPRMEGILKKNNYPYRVKAVMYEKGSHVLGYWEQDRKFRKILKMMCPIEKKYPSECEEAREESTQEILRFFEEW